MSRYISVTDTAKLIRKALALQFPGVKFSVRSSSYSGGASIDVRWTDGPTGKEVDVVLHQYEGASFDGMIDLKSTHNSLLSNEDGSVEEVHYGADYVFGHRDMSPERKAEIQEWFKAETGQDLEPNKQYLYSVVRHQDEYMGILSHNNQAGSDGYGSQILNHKFSVTSYFKAPVAV